MPGNFTKTKVDSRVAAAAVLIATAIGVSALTATLIPQAGSGKFYASGDKITLPPAPPHPPACCYDGKKDAKWVNSSSECKNYDRRATYCGAEYAVATPAGSAGECICKRCPDGYTQNGDVCCNNLTETPGSTYVPLKGTIYYCKPKTCTDPNKPYLCKGSTQDACCQAAANCTTNYLGVAYCLDNDGCKKGDTGYCTDNLCCETNEECKSQNGIYWCQPKDQSSCATGQTYCVGTGDYTDRHKCCNSGTTCRHHPNGYPYCL